MKLTTSDKKNKKIENYIYRHSFIHKSSKVDYAPLVSWDEGKI